MVTSQFYWLIKCKVVTPSEESKVVKRFLSMYSCDFFFDSWYFQSDFDVKTAIWLKSNYWSSETRVDPFQSACKIQEWSYLSDHTTAKVISLIGFPTRVHLIQSTCHPTRKWKITFLSRRVIYEPPLCPQDRHLKNFRICACCVSSHLWESSEQQLFTGILIKVLSNEGKCCLSQQKPNR